MPAIPRCQWIDLQRDYRQWYRAHHTQRQQRLTWHRPGSVWGVDHSQPPELVDGVDPQMLAVRDLASGLQLAWLPQGGAGASEASQVMEYLFRKYGPPLVLKSDNGSAFISDQWQSLLQRWHVTPLYSPVAHPQYNGSVEAGIGAMKVRTEMLARAREPGTCWTQVDMDQALKQANHLHRRAGDLQHSAFDRWQTRSEITSDERREFEKKLDENRSKVHNQFAEGREAKRTEARGGRAT